MTVKVRTITKQLAGREDDAKGLARKMIAANAHPTAVALFRALTESRIQSPPLPVSAAKH